jgi:hypothetical protein
VHRERVAVRVRRVDRRALAEVGLDGAHAHLEQRQQLLGVPARGVRVREVEDGGRAEEAVEVPRLAVGSGGEPAVLLAQRVEGAAHADVRDLPQAEPEAVLAQAGDHPGRVGEALRRELEVVDPLGGEPVGVDVDDVAGDALLAQPPGDLLHLALLAVGHPAHPQPEAPRRRDGRDAGQRRVAGQHVAQVRPGDQEGVQEGVLHVHAVVDGGQVADVVGDRAEPSW